MARSGGPLPLAEVVARARALVGAHGRGLVIGSDRGDTAVLRKLTAGNFNDDTSELLIWRADWARRLGDQARSLTYADSARTMLETLVGEHDAAIKRLAYLLTIPSELSAPLLRADPMWAPLRGNPGFQTLTAAPR